MTNLKKVYFELRSYLQIRPCIIISDCKATSVPCIIISDCKAISVTPTQNLQTTETFDLLKKVHRFT